MLLIVNFTTWIGQTEYVILTDVIAKPLRIGLWVVFWGYWFRLHRRRLLHRVVWSLVAILAIGTAMLRPPLYGAHVPVHVGDLPAAFSSRRKAWPRCPAPDHRLPRLQRGIEGKGSWWGSPYFSRSSRTLIVSYGSSALSMFQRPLTSSDFSINLGSISTILSLLIITVMLLRRFITAQRAKEQWKLEIAQARHMQQVLIPNKLPQINDLNIDSEYRPAREVGGDFFQIVPKEEDGTSLIVFGDVTGKGLQAGMLVALIIGAIRSTAQHDNSPERILEALNEQLCERESASATCMVLRFLGMESLNWPMRGSFLRISMAKRCRLKVRFRWGCCPGWSFRLRRSSSNRATLL